MHALHNAVFADMMLFNTRHPSRRRREGRERESVLEPILSSLSQSSAFVAPLVCCRWGLHRSSSVSCGGRSAACCVTPSTQARKFSPSMSVTEPADESSTSSLSDVSNDHATDGIPKIRRSKLILTRRVYAVDVNPQQHGQQSLVHRGRSIQEAPLPPLIPVHESAFAPEMFLDPNSAKPGYFLTRGAPPFPHRRRSGDPPARFLELRHGMVSPDSPYARNCANPKVTNCLRRWYANAIKWNALHCDFRPVVSLTANRLVTPPELHRKTRTSARPSKASTNTGTSEGDAQERNSESMHQSSHSSAAINSSKPLSPLLVSNGTEKARTLARTPRVIVIGDVHGCIDEFQALLRLADFQPGDQVILLGDLVAKGPDSVSVVQMARDIGARSVRGNHDHEVIRWCEAQSKGVQNVMISAEHSQIAHALGPGDFAWLLEAPWFISAPETRHLFVHAGFIPGVRLTQQNPRLMMNMRSVLEDGTVTAKNVPECGWARLWRGPETVVFGHDAHRGLQQHEFAKGIDTGCVYGGRLTALLLPENRFVSVAAKRAYILERTKFRNSK